MIEVSLVAIPEAGTSLVSAAELFGTVGVAWNTVVEGSSPRPAFRARLVAERAEEVACSGRWPLRPDAAVADIARTDIIFIPSLWLMPGETFAGRYEQLKEWLVRQYRGGAIVCAACTGVALLADTGLLDGETATVHWAYAETLRRHYPRIVLDADRVLVASGPDGRLITSGGHAAWYDAVLHLVSRTCGPEAASRTARFFLLEWHAVGQTAQSAFHPRRDHGDAIVRDCQEWLARNLSDPTPVESVERASGLAPRTFKRRFKAATGLTVIAYVQRLRVEHAKSLLVASDAAVDDVGWRVGYADVAFFRRLFKRLTGLTPGDYRRRFQPPRPAARSRRQAL